MYDVVALGELLIDFTTVSTDHDGYPTLAAHPGGAPANFLAAVAKFGGRTAFLGKVGTDVFGQSLNQTLQAYGIDTTGLIRSDDCFTTLAFVTLDQNGDRTFSFARKPGADTQITFKELPLGIIDNTTAFHFGTLSLTHEPSRSATYQAVTYAKERGKLISFDPNLRKPLWRDLHEAKKQILWGLEHADVVKISEEEVEFLFGLGAKNGAAHIMSNYPTKLLFLTCGADGCWYHNRVSMGHVDSLHDIKVIDTTGAGDIFGGSAIWQLIQTNKQPDQLDDAELRRIVAFACKAAGLSTTKHGGISSVPDLSEVLCV